MRFICKTFFDITTTGVTGHYKASRVPFDDLSHNPITDEGSWNYARNQQRNWETITQLIGLRAQIAKIDNPIKVKNLWMFEFEVETSYAYGSEENPTEMLESDCNGVPMLLSLGNKKNLGPVLTTSGDDQNIWFEALL